MTRRLLATLSLLALAGHSGAATAAPRPNLPDQVELGRDGNGDPCSAARYWNDPGAADPFAVSYGLTCRGATASRHLGVARWVRSGQSDAIAALLTCGAAKEVAVPALGMVRARRCFDKLLGLTTVETELIRNGHLLSVSAIPIAQGPAEEALRMLAGIPVKLGERNRTVAPVIDVAALAPAPEAQAAATAANDADSALQQGLRYVRQGLHMEASRVLNDGLSRLPPDAPIGTRVELLLVAGLADSNLRFFDSAESYFAHVDQLLLANPGIPNAAVLALKRRSYAALDLLNRRKFGEAITALDQIASQRAEPGQPLLDPTLIRALNQAPARGRQAAAEAVRTPDVGSLSQLVIDAQANWARSVALLAQNKPADANAALALADRNFEVLRNEKIDQQQVRWLEARIERQRARLLLRNGDRAGAVAALDRAVLALRRADADGATGPTLAETELERAGVLARGGGDSQALLANFEDAVDSLIAADAQGAVLPPSIEQYLDLLIADAKTHPEGKSPERFFRALQAVGDPAIARQFVQLQTVVTADPHLAAKVQDVQDLEREITRIRFEIASGPAGTDTKTLDAKRQQLEAQLVETQAALEGNKAYGAVNDAPVTIAELRRALHPGEAYFKLTKVRNYDFGMLIDATGTVIYRIKNPDIEVDPVAKVVRASIDGGGDKLPHYNVGAAYALFTLVAGPATDRLLAANALVVDASGPLQTLPLGVLVTDKASVERYAASRAAAPYDYTGVDFVAKQVSLSTALSPRSLIVARNLAPSAARYPFMGFAQHEPVPVSAEVSGRMISIGSNCEVEQKAIALLTRELTPINARELDRAGAALGLSQVPELIGAAFTDTAVKQRTDLDQFQVLHFATHGLTEGQWGCAKAPPALVTSLGPDGSDAILSFDEIARLRLDANLVVLSACDTAAGVSLSQARAAGQEEAGATLEGLVRAFLAANARAVLSTYWPISNAGESEQLIADFYHAARQGTIGEALRTAQSGLMANPASSHPIFWGAFFVVGDAQKPLLTGTARAAIAAASASTLASR
ncbi:MAG: CHAT domain-containing protein [Novosphingobium sp.]|nr:CHAT domain-containing protein [Novosphingobium sp.]